MVVVLVLPVADDDLCVQQRVEAVDVESQEQVLRRCLESNGWVTDADSSGWELAQQALQAMIDTDGGVDCLKAADIDGL